jgi:hypothetical protein
MRLFILIITCALFASCASPPNVEVNTEEGRHPLPFRANQRFILTKVTKDNTLFESPKQIEYFLDGRRRTFLTNKVGASDGYVTYLGRVLTSEVEGVESPIMDEQIIRLKTGDEITIAGNTVNPGGIRMQKLNKQPAQMKPNKNAEQDRVRR